MIILMYLLVWLYFTVTYRGGYTYKRFSRLCEGTAERHTNGCDPRKKTGDALIITITKLADAHDSPTTTNDGFALSTNTCSSYRLMTRAAIRAVATIEIRVARLVRVSLPSGPTS